MSTIQLLVRRKFLSAIPRKHDRLRNNSPHRDSICWFCHYHGTRVAQGNNRWRRELFLSLITGGVSERRILQEELGKTLNGQRVKVSENKTAWIEFNSRIELGLHQAGMFLFLFHLFDNNQLAYIHEETRKVPSNQGPSYAWHFSNEPNSQFAANILSLNLFILSF